MVECFNVIYSKNTFLNIDNRLAIYLDGHPILDNSLMTTQPKDLFPLKKILVSTDGSENANRAVQTAIQLAKQNDSELLIVTVLAMIVPRIYTPIAPFPSEDDYNRFLERAKDEGNKIVDQAVSEAKNESINARGNVVTSMTSVAESILDTAETEKVDLIVVGTRGLGGFKKLLLGSVSSAIVAHALCAVLVIR